MHLLSLGGRRGRRDGQIILSVPRGSRASPSENESSRILSFSPSSHLGNGATFICKLWGLEENVKSQKAASPRLLPPFPSLAWPACPLAFFPTPPCALFISASASLGRSPAGFCRPLPPPTFYFPCFGAAAASGRIQPPHLCSCVCIPWLLVTRGSRSTGFSGS